MSRTDPRIRSLGAPPPKFPAGIPCRTNPDRWSAPANQWVAAAAAHKCRTCPALTQCGDYADRLPANRREGQVWAGREPRIATSKEGQ